MVATIIRILCVLLALTMPLAARAACEPGPYGVSPDIVALTPKAHISSPGLGYLFLDGRFGSTLSESSPIRCVEGAVFVRGENSAETRLERREIVRTSTKFMAAGAELAGELLEPAGTVDPSRALLVMVHGSERSPAIGENTRALLFAAQGIAVFTYDKRGAGQSEGFYTQNFELLADDAAAAMVHAQQLAGGRFGRAGYFGGSQGGWVAPLAATRSDADFVAVGFGLVASPIDEDRDQMILEAQKLGLGEEVIRQIHHLSEMTARIATSHFSDGFEELDAARKAWGDEAWTNIITGEYSGDMLRMSDADLRRVGRALFDNLELIWDYDSLAALQKLDIPLLWVIAAEDREAPAEATMQALVGLKANGRPIDAYVFPQTDHGMYEFVQQPDSSRRYTRVTDGYFRLLADWIHSELDEAYGRGAPLVAAGYVFENVNVIPMDEETVLRGKAVAVKNREIIAIVDQADAASLVAEERIDGQGRFLMPGLADMHVHVRWDPQAMFKLFIANGVTAVANMGIGDGNGKFDHLKLQVDVAAGEIVGPRYIVSGPHLDDSVLPSIEAVESMLEEHMKQGFDVVKIHGDLAPDVYDALIAGARARNLRVTGHAQHMMPLSKTLKMDSLEHMEEFLYVARDADFGAAAAENFLEAYRDNTEQLWNPDVDRSRRRQLWHICRSYTDRL